MMARSPARANPKRLLVEGSDDQHAIVHLALQHNMVVKDPPGFEVTQEGGISNLLATLRVAIEPGSAIDRMGVVVDADSPIMSRWESLGGILRPHYAEFPVAPIPGGVVLAPQDPDRPRIGVWLMPDNQRDGMLEDFLLDAIAPEDALLPLAARALDGIPIALCRHHAIHRSKALVYTWLPWQEEPGLPFGTAVKAKFLDARAPRIMEFLAWLARLFD